MSKFNPFRLALYHLRTSEDHDRGVFNLQGSNSLFICCALAKMGNHGTKYADRQLVNKAIEHVERMLGGYNNVGDWLIDQVPAAAEWFKANGNIGPGPMPNPVPTHIAEELQAYRWRWLTHLADHFDNGEIKL